jgi:hypothetical protein
MTSVKVFEGLPETCFGVLESTNELIMITRGQMGYSPQRLENAPWDASVVDIVNEQRGVTKAQRRAMETGSMFGWGVRGANPKTWDENGNLKEEV